MQSRRRSIYEAGVNIAVGLGLSIWLNFSVLRYQGLEVTWTGMSGLAIVLTIASFVRQYCLRRLFNWGDR